MKHSHESEELNNLLGKKVHLKFWDGEECEGYLRKPKPNYERGHYAIDRIRKNSNTFDTLTFEKSHITKVYEVK